MKVLNVFIHGIGSDKKTWKSFIKFLKKDIGKETFIEYYPNKSKIDVNKEYFILYDYKSKKFEIAKNWVTNFFTKITGRKYSGNVTIERHSESFLTYLDINSENFDRVNIVAHSMGGIISFNVAFHLILEKHTLLNKINTFILYGSPLLGSEEPKELVKRYKLKIASNILNELKTDSITIKKLNENINELHKQLESKFSIVYINGDADSRINAITREYVKRFGKFESVQGGHSDIITPKSLSDISLNLLKRYIKNEDRINLVGIDDDLEIQENLINFLNNSKDLNEEELNDLNRLIQEIADNSQKRGGANNITLLRKDTTFTLIDNGKNFNPLEELSKTEQGGTFTLSYFKKIHTRFEIKYQNIYNDNYFIVNYKKYENKNPCYIKSETTRINKRITDLYERIDKAIESKCEKIVLDLSKDYITKISNHKMIIEKVRDFKNNNKNLLIEIHIDKKNTMLLNAYETIFKDIIEKHNIEIYIK